MPVHFRCPCGIVLNAPDGGPGKGGECPSCGKVVVIPANAVEIAEADLDAAPAPAEAKAPPPEAAPAPAPEAEPEEAPLALAPEDEPAEAPEPEPAPAPVRTPTPVPKRAVTPVPKRTATPVPKRRVTPVPKRSVTPVPATAVAAGGDAQLVPEGAPPEAISDDDILPADAIEVVDDAEQPVAVPDSLNALDGLGMADAEPLDEAVDEADEGEEPDMDVDRGAGRVAGRASRRAGGGRTGRTRRPRKCPECNSENEPGARECANCGAQLRGAPHKSGGGLKKILVVLILLVLVAGGGAFAAGYFALNSMPQAFRNLWTSMGLPSKGAVIEEKAPETGGGEAVEPKKEETPPAGELPPEGYVPDTGEDVSDAPSAREDRAIGVGAGGIAIPDSTPDLGGGGPATPDVVTGDGISE